MSSIKHKSYWHFLAGAIAFSSLVLFLASSLRHNLFQSSFDLAIFDNAIYLISQGQTSFVTFRGLHILGDHAALIVYPIAWLYKIYPSIYWLFAIQALSLSGGAIPIYYLSRATGLIESQGKTLVLAYLLYPAIFNVNLFDFHPEVIAVPAILAAILAAKLDRFWWFIAALIVILSCKAVLALTVVGIGVWLLISSKYRYKYASIALVLGYGWFAIATQVIIPTFSGTEAAAIDRYGYLGNSVFDIAKNLVLKPNLVLDRVLSLDTIEYIFLLIIPLAWGLVTIEWMPIIGALPILLLNILSESSAQRNLVHQYSLPIVPWLFLIVIMAANRKQLWFKSQRNILIWSAIAFLAFGKYGYFGSLYLQSWDTRQASRQAIALIDDRGGVLTTTDLAPHLTHRSLVGLTTSDLDSKELNKFEYILLNLRHPGWGSSMEIATAILTKLQKTPHFQLDFQQDDVFLFSKIENFDT